MAKYKENFAKSYVSMKEIEYEHVDNSNAICLRHIVGLKVFHFTHEYVRETLRWDQGNKKEQKLGGEKCRFQHSFI